MGRKTTEMTMHSKANAQVSTLTPSPAYLEGEVRRRRPGASLASAGTAVAALVLGACVTINVYFPAAAIKDLSRQIEDEVDKKAAEGAAAAPASPAAKPTDTPSAKPGAAPRTGALRSPAGLFESILGITPAYAEGGDVAAPEVTSPAIRKIIDSRASRAMALAEQKSKGVIGENNKALVEVRSLDSLPDLKARAEVQRLVKAENTDREELFKEIAAAKNVDLSQIPKIRETYAATLREKAHPGDWIQEPEGKWRQK
jgi:uncharacterized protein YdbL (DUF1318 family)